MKECEYKNEKSDFAMESQRVKKIAGEMVREYRKKNGLSQDELGKIVGYSQVYIGCLETGKRNIDLSCFWNLSLVLGFTMREFHTRAMTDKMRDEEMIHRAERRKKFNDKMKEIRDFFDDYYEEMNGR